MPHTLDSFQVSAGIAATIIDSAAKHGVDAKPIAFACGLDPNLFGQVDKTLNIDGLCRLLEALSALTGDPAFGLNAGAAFEKGSSGVLGYGMKCAPTAADAVDLLVKYLQNVDTIALYNYSESKTEVRIEWTYSPLLVKRDQYVDLAFVIIMAHFKSLLGPDFERVRCEMERPRPSKLKAFKALICNQIYFNCDANSCNFPVDALSRKNPEADPRLFTILLKQIESAPQNRVTSRDPIVAVQQYIATSLGKTPATLASAAARVGMSERTLQRRLTEAGTTLQEMLDQCRRELAEKLLTESSLSLSEISYRLGFSAPSAFTRSAIRWFGVSPSVFRKIHGNNPA